jgi:diguanylate cyclase (GGDEF)-like protein
MNDFQALQGEEDAPPIDPDARLQQFREAFVDDSMRGIVYLALCILAVSFWRNAFGPEELRWRLGFVVVSSAATLLTVVFLNRRRLSYCLKSRTLLLVLFLVGAAGLVSFGHNAPTGNYFAVGFFIAAILYPRSVVFAMIAGVVALMVLVAYGLISGLYVLTLNLNELSRQPLTWLNLIMTMALTAGTIATAVGSFTRSVYGLLGDLNSQRLEIRRQRDQIRHLATHDKLTGLPLLALANDRSQMAIAHARRRGHQVAFMFIDLDGFKEINDRHGHDAGDAVLTEVARRLRASVRASDTAARIGGDEFLFILGELADSRAAGEVAEKMLNSLATPIAHAPHQIRVGASIGIAIFPDHAEELGALKKAADQAMYGIKARGKNHFAFAPSPPDQPLQSACQTAPV